MTPTRLKDFAALHYCDCWQTVFGVTVVLQFSDRDHHSFERIQHFSTFADLRTALGY